MTNTVTQTATIESGKMKNCRTRNGVVWRTASGDGSVGSETETGTEGSAFGSSGGVMGDAVSRGGGASFKRRP